MAHAERVKKLMRKGPFPPDRLLGALLAMAEVETERSGIRQTARWPMVRAAALESEAVHMDLAHEAKRQGWDPSVHMVADALAPRLLPVEA